jgi:hypothetical protein
LGSGGSVSEGVANCHPQSVQAILAPSERIGGERTRVDIRVVETTGAGQNQRTAPYPVTGPKDRKPMKKNPLDSLGQTIVLGVVLTVVVAVLIHVISGA